MSIPQEGERFKHRTTGTIFEIKKITHQFVILQSVDDLKQILAEKEGIAIHFELEKVPEMDPS
jgi:hypothetical protein